MNLIRDAPIARASRGGTNLEVVAEFLPADIALDLAARKLYWVTGDPSRGGVMRRSNLDGTDLATVLDQLHHPVDIGLDVHRGWMYWVERDAGAIRRAKLDGTDMEEVISQLTEPSRLALSFENSGTSVGVAPRA